MTKNEINEIKSIISELKREFSNEEERLSSLERERTIKLDELDHQISSAKKNEDIDFKVFSPRNVNSSISEKISGMEQERKKLEQLLGDASRQKIYYSGKTEKLSRVLEILSENNVEVVEEVVEKKDSFDWFSQFNKSSDDTISSEDSDQDKKDSVIADTSVNGKDNSIIDSLVIDTIDDSSDIEKIDTKEVSKKINKIIRKAQLGEKVIDNDRRRAHTVINEVIDELKSILKCFT